MFARLNRSAEAMSIEADCCPPIPVVGTSGGFGSSVDVEEAPFVKGELATVETTNTTAAMSHATAAGTNRPLVKRSGVSSATGGAGGEAGGEAGVDSERSLKADGAETLAGSRSADAPPSVAVTKARSGRVRLILLY